jgi:hypothetical protein
LICSKDPYNYPQRLLRRFDCEGQATDGPPSSLRAASDAASSTARFNASSTPQRRPYPSPQRAVDTSLIEPAQAKLLSLPRTLGELGIRPQSRFQRAQVVESVPPAPPNQPQPNALIRTSPFHRRELLRQIAAPSPTPPRIAIPPPALALPELEIGFAAFLAGISQRRVPLMGGRPFDFSKLGRLKVGADPLILKTPQQQAAHLICVGRTAGARRRLPGPPLLETGSLRPPSSRRAPHRCRSASTRVLLINIPAASPGERSQVL